MSPKNCFTSLGFHGGNIFCILSNFSGTGAIPSPNMICPKYMYMFHKKVTFDFNQF